MSAVKSNRHPHNLKFPESETPLIPPERHEKRPALQHDLRSPNRVGPILDQARVRVSLAVRMSQTNYEAKQEKAITKKGPLNEQF